MTDFSSPAVGGGPLNNTWFFEEQDKGGRRWTAWRGWFAALILLSLTSAACRSSAKKSAGDEAAGSTAKGDNKGDKTSGVPRIPAPPPLDMAALPVPWTPRPAGAAAPRTGGTLRVHLGGEPPHLEPTGERPAVRNGPETHVVALGGVAVHLLLVGESLSLPEEEQ